jgi:hypothetical protein
MKTIISKNTVPFLYQEWKKVNGQFFTVGNGILIHGGAGIVGGIDRDSGRPLEQHGIAIPEGVATIIDDDTYDRLKENGKFKQHLRNGIVKVLSGSISDQAKIDDETHDMRDNDLINSRPYSKEDFEAANGVINRDGSVNITEAAEDIEAVRRSNAGKMAYMKKRDAEERQQKRRGRPRKNG